MDADSGVNRIFYRRRYLITDFGLNLGTFLVRFGGITAPSSFAITTLARPGYAKLQSILRSEPLDTLSELTNDARCLEIML